MDAGRPPRIMKRSAGLVGGARVDRRPAEAACERLGCYVKVGAQSGGSRLGTGESFQRRVPGGCVVRAGSGGPRRRRPAVPGHEGQPLFGLTRGICQQGKVPGRGRGGRYYEYVRAV